MNNTEKESFSYASFWTRLWASLIDTMLFLLPIYVLYFLIYGKDSFLNPPEYSILEMLLENIYTFSITFSFWFYKQATPGKMLFKVKIVDATTYEKASTKQYIIRYIGYFISLIPMGLGYFWVLWDKKNQALHDKLAHTIVIGPKYEVKKISTLGYFIRRIAIFLIFIFVILFVISLLLDRGTLVDQLLYLTIFKY